MYKIIIIGAGPAGISMASEAVAAGIDSRKILLLEKAHEHSFTIKKYYPEKKLVTANFKGFKAECAGTMCLVDSSKEETITYLDKAIEENNLTVHYNETVYKIDKHPDGSFTVFTDEDSYKSKVVTIAVGILGKPNKPDYKIPGSLKQKVLFDVTSQDIENSDVLVVGGGDSASEYAQYLSEKGNKVTLSYRKDKFTRMNHINAESINAMAEAGKLELLLNSNIEAIADNNGKPEVIFEEENYGKKIFDYVIFALGGSTPENFLKLIGIEFNGPEPVLKEGYETNIPGLFLLGDLTAGKKGGSIIWAFNSANTAMRKICSNHLDCKI